MKLTDIRRRVLLVAAGVACLTTAGCGDGRPGRVAVAGQVLIDGEPLTHGSIMFIPPDSRPAGGTLDSNGRFTLTCYEPGDGAIPGHYRVKVVAIESIGERSNRWHAPKKYADDKTSGIEQEITQPTDDMKIELTWSGGKPFVERW